MFSGVYLLGGVGLLFLILGLAFSMIGKKTFNCTAVTEGRIIDMCYNAYDYNNGNSGRTAVGIYIGTSDPGMFCPVFTYRVNGIEYTRASYVSWNKGQINRKMNKPRTIYYNPENPQEASLSKRSILTLMGTIFILVGAVTIAAGVLFFIF